jgi:hypothetical protein
MTYCVLPWVNITVDPDGSIKPCCVSQDFIKKPTGEKFNLGFDKIEDIVNSKDLVEIRQKMLAGEKVAGCSQCYQHEEYGGKSQRLQYNQMFPLKFSVVAVGFWDCMPIPARKLLVTKSPEAGIEFIKQPFK